MIRPNICIEKILEHIHEKTLNQTSRTYIQKKNCADDAFSYVCQLGFFFAFQFRRMTFFFYLFIVRTQLISKFQDADLVLYLYFVLIFIFGILLDIHRWQSWCFRCCCYSSTVFASCHLCFFLFYLVLILFSRCLFS